MAIINRKSGMVKGRMGDEIYSRSRWGRQCVRKAEAEYISRNSSSRVEVKAAMSTFSSMWRELPGNIKAAWDMYASQQGSASEVEANDNVSYRGCPIPNYPPRPKLVDGQGMFVGVNIIAYKAGLANLPRLNPPLGLALPPLPLFTCEYQRSTGEVIVNMEGAALPESRDVEATRAQMWLTAYSTINGKYMKIVDSKMLDTFDLPRAPERAEKRYAGIAETQKPYDYKPLSFKEPPYLRIHLGARIVVSPGEKWAPIVSAGNWVVMYLLNQTQFIEVGDLIDAGLVKNVGQLKFNENTAKLIAKKRQELTKGEFIKVSEK